MMSWRSVVMAMCAFSLFSFVAVACAEDEPQEAFSFATDDMCAWVSEDEVAEFVSAEFDWDGTAVETGSGRGGCEWALTDDDGDTGYLEASDVREWTDFDDNPVDPVEMVGDVSDFDPEDPFSGAVSGHPALSEGVVAFNAMFGQFAFWVPPVDEYLGFSLAVPGVEDVFEGNGFFAVADHIVEELGWLSEQ